MSVQAVIGLVLIGFFLFSKLNEKKAAASAASSATLQQRLESYWTQPTGTEIFGEPLTSRNSTLANPTPARAVRPETVADNDHHKDTPLAYWTFPFGLSSGGFGIW
jgi:hypothetical protein